MLVHKAMDPEGSGPAFTYKIPQGWIAQDSVYWNRKLRVNPMSFAFTTSSGDQQMLLSYISALSFDFASNGYQSAGKPPPQRPSEYLDQAFQSVHPNSQAQVLGREDTPIQYPYQPARGAIGRAFHSTLRVGFNSNGINSVENLSYNFYCLTRPNGVRGTRGNWIVDGLTIIVAPTDEEAAGSQLAHQILGTAQMTPQFLDKYQRVTASILAETKAETKAQAAAAKKAPRRTKVIYVYDRGGSSSRHYDKDTFILHEALRSLRCRIFNYAMGN